MSVQSLQALEVGNAARLERSRLRHDIRAGRTDWRTIILNPPPCLGEMLLTEVLVMMVPGIHRVTVETLGRRAFHAGLTLTVRARRASMNTRRWLVATVPTVQSGSASRGRGPQPRRRARASVVPL